MIGEMRLPKLWINVRHDVGRKDYLLSGCILMVVMYAGEVALAWILTREFYRPHDFLAPMQSVQLNYVSTSTMSAKFIWTIPFVWIALSMSVRRAVDAGCTAWVGVLVLVPYVNYVVMLLLVAGPSRPRETPAPSSLVSPGWSQFKNFLIGTLSGVTFGISMMALSVYAFQTYAAVLFIITPLLVGAVAAFFCRVSGGQVRRAFFCSFTAILVLYCALVLFALEGFVCILMAAPLAIVMALLGAGIGTMIARFGPAHRKDLLLLLTLPLACSMESHLTSPPLKLVTTSVEIEAPIEVVWRNVVEFPPLAEPQELHFRAGIAYPTGARIEGSGVGAVRYCEFSTGAFIEPITTWDAPTHLAFDVREQPDPMRELSLYDIHPPHLDWALMSERGEFRLEPIGQFRTRLTGNTWYRLDMAPYPYWSMWTDAIIHSIHKRVLRHVAAVSE